jgi:cell division protein FtsB
MQINTQYVHKAISFIQRLGDVRFAGQVLFVVLVLLISWSGIKTIQTNYGLQKQITGLKQQNDLKRLQNNNLELENQYYQSNQYLELMARQNFGLAAAGEKEVLVPEKVALAYTTNIPVTETEEIVVKPPAYQQNLQSWVDFFLHRKGRH